MKNISTPNKNFLHDIENWQNVQVETAEFWFNEANNLVGATRETFIRLQSHAEKLLGFSGVAITTISAILTYLYANEAFLLISWIALPSAIMTVLYLVIIILCISALKQQGIAQVGVQPKHVMLNSFANLDKNAQYRDMLLNAAEAQQDAIDNNFRIINQTSIKTQKAYMLFCWTPIIGLAIVPVLYLIKSLVLFTLLPFIDNCNIVV